jgi:hypothetical protein
MRSNPSTNPTIDPSDESCGEAIICKGFHPAWADSCHSPTPVVAANAQGLIQIAAGEKISAIWPMVNALSAPRWSF